MMPVAASVYLSLPARMLFIDAHLIWLTLHAEPLSLSPSLSLALFLGFLFLSHFSLFRPLTFLFFDLCLPRLCISLSVPPLCISRSVSLCPCQPPHNREAAENISKRSPETALEHSLILKFQVTLRKNPHASVFEILREEAKGWEVNRGLGIGSVKTTCKCRMSQAI